ncbi:MAG: hypothetical protein DYG99_16125 [Bacteroidetes bacterium CHB5]|nr:hypothetical protein [Bacteroidetes bacterium CHB5]
MRWFYLFVFVLILACSSDPEVPQQPLQVNEIRVGSYTLNLTDPSKNIAAPLDQPIQATFASALATSTVEGGVQLRIKNGDEVPLTFTFLDSDKTFSALPDQLLDPFQEYELVFTNELRGAQGEVFPGLTFGFTTVPGTLTITSLKFNSVESLNTSPVTNITNIQLEVTFSAPIKPEFATPTYFKVSDNQNLPVTLSLSPDQTKVTITSNEELPSFVRHQLWISSEVTGVNKEILSTYTKTFYSGVNPNPVFPVLSDEDLLTLVQQQTFKYFWDFAHPASGMARERNTSGDLVTSGGSGFGLMAIVVGIERGFITRQQGIERLDKILDFLETSDRFHGAWSHWINGNTGAVIPFSTNDNGGDLVETAFLVQGLITVRQYLNAGNATESELRTRITSLYEGVEWDWYRRENQNVLYWHWSPDKNWTINLPVRGWNEALMVYLLAAASPTHTIPKIVYDNGWANNGNIINGNVYEGITLPLGSAYGGPLFLSQYSFLGLDPRDLSDAYCADYFIQNRNHTLINYKYCIRNPLDFVGYSSTNWGLTASDNHQGYSAHSPTNDLGVITPSAALSAFPYTPEESMDALKFFYYTLGNKLWGPYGFYDAFNITEGWYASSYLAIDQGPIIVMIENYRTGLLWNLFMSAPEIQTGLTKLGFTY